MRVPPARLALALWVAWAIVVWNVIFDRVIVVAGRDYVVAAIRSANDAGIFLDMDDWMRPAVARGLWIATAAASSIVAAAFLLVRAATRAARPIR
jgi:hypothetical protein